MPGMRRGANACRGKRTGAEERGMGRWMCSYRFIRHGENSGGAAYGLGCQCSPEDVRCGLMKLLFAEPATQSTGWLLYAARDRPTSLRHGLPPSHYY